MPWREGIGPKFFSNSFMKILICNIRVIFSLKSKLQRNLNKNKPLVVVILEP